MRESYSVRLMLLAVLVAASMVSGCISDGDDDEVVKPGDTLTETSDVELGTATEVEVYLNLGHGELKVRPGASKLMEATFRFNVEQWRPEVTYVEGGTVWNLSVVMPNETLKVGSGTINEWSIDLGEDVPTSMVVLVGAGSVDCKVGGLNLTAFSANVGSGSLDLDLTGEWGANLTVYLNAGAGDIDIKVPDDVGARVKPVMGVGSFDGQGFTQEGGFYVNAAHATSDVILTIHANSGVGGIKVTEVP
jgi:hypothetical protein